MTRARNRPLAPSLTFADAFAALVSQSPVNVAGPHWRARFSWGRGDLAAAETLYATNFGKGSTSPPTFANYPVCYGANR